MARITGTGQAVRGLGGRAGFGETVLPRSDDGSLRVDVGAVFQDGFQFGSQRFDPSQFYVGTNGLVSFGQAVGGWRGALGRIDVPFIAAFHADVDTRKDGEGKESGPVWVDVDSGSDVVTITWQNVGFYRRNADATNTFQLQLFDRGSDGFDIVLRYGLIGWTSGDLQGGWAGTGGEAARIGWRLANADRLTELGASGREDRLLALADTVGNTGVEGLWVYRFEPPRLAMGGRANDVLVGGQGADRLFGGGGEDRLIGLRGADLLHGGAGFDFVDYRRSGAGLTVDLADGAQNRGAAASGDRFVSVEGVLGSRFDDKVTGNDTDNRLSGLGGRDSLQGGQGRDTLDGGGGNDRLSGQDGRDRTEGGQGADTLTGGDGADMLIGGAGRDLLSGGLGADQFILRRAAHGDDVIADYRASQGDVLQFQFDNLDRSDLGLRFRTQAGRGEADVAEAILFHRPTGVTLVTLVDAENATAILVRIGVNDYDLI